MSKYTSELRFICESLTSHDESVDNTHSAQVIAAAAPLIFSFSFPIFDNSYKQGLEEKIIRHYYTREIGFETYGLFKLKLETKMNEIMPYYNQLYNSAMLTLDPLNNYKLHKTSAGQNAENTTSSGTANSTESRTTSGSLNSTIHNTDGRTVGVTTSGQTSGTSSDTAWSKFSDTPQGAVTGLDNDSYLTNATKNTDSRSDSGTSSGTSSTTDSGTADTQRADTNSGSENSQRADTTSGTGSRSGTNSYVEDVIGFSGVNQSELLQKFRETFLNIDMMIINELEELFFQLW